MAAACDGLAAGVYDEALSLLRCSSSSLATASTLLVPWHLRGRLLPTACCLLSAARTNGTRREMLRRPSSLSRVLLRAAQLGLHRNQIYDAGAHAFAKALVANRTLKRVYSHVRSYHTLQGDVHWSPQWLPRCWDGTSGVPDRTLPP